MLNFDRALPPGRQGACECLSAILAASLPAKEQSECPGLLRSTRPGEGGSVPPTRVRSLLLLLLLLILTVAAAAVAASFQLAQKKRESTHLPQPPASREGRHLQLPRRAGLREAVARGFVDGLLRLDRAPPCAALLKAAAEVGVVKGACDSGAPCLP